MDYKKQFLNHRRAIGVLGALLPFLCLIFGSFYNTHPNWNKTISSTYYTSAGDIFVGVLFILSTFLLTYSGYDVRDRIINRICGISALGIAIFPASGTYLSNVGVFQLNVETSFILHCIFAVIFFITLIINILWLFTKSDGEQTKNKIIRNKIYKICGYGIIFFLIMLGIFIICPFWKYLGFFSETMVLLLFATSWIIKGETLFKD